MFSSWQSVKQVGHDGTSVRLTWDEHTALLEPLDYSVRARKILCRIGINSIDDIADITDAQLRATKNCGASTIHEIREKYEDHRRSVDVTGN